jgi:protocatechuate 3,4-dioxygenase beta subunit
MPRIITPPIGRRSILGGLAAATAAGLGPARLALAQAGRILTPAQTEGPFYPPDWNGDIDNDLVMVHGEAARALGQVTHVLGRVLDQSGQAIADAMIEIWQCDNNGRYRHPGDRSGNRPRDPAFQGRGRSVSASDGRYAFRTIRPVPYPGRTPHIHFAIAAPGRARLVTQMYVAGEPLNATDGLLSRIRDARQRDSVIVPLAAADGIEAGALAGIFDIVLG